MKELDNNLALCEILKAKFAEDLEKVFNRQAVDRKYLKREAFKSCLERAEAAYADATYSGIKMLAYAIAKENELNHPKDGDTKPEQEILSKVMTNEEKEIAETRGGWMG